MLDSLPEHHGFRLNVNVLTATVLRLGDLWERYKVRDVVQTIYTSRPFMDFRTYAL